MERRGLQMESVENFRSVVSQGVEGELGGQHYLVGNDRLFRHRSLDPPSREMHRGGTEVWLGEALDGGGTLLARFALVDEVRPTSQTAVEQLRKLNVVPLLVSGDAVSVAERTAAGLGIDDVHGEVRPEDKATIIAALEERRCEGRHGGRRRQRRAGAGTGNRRNRDGVRNRCCDGDRADNPHEARSEACRRRGRHQPQDVSARSSRTCFGRSSTTLSACRWRLWDSSAPPLPAPPWRSRA